MTVRELIEKLQALPEADQDLDVEHLGCYAYEVDDAPVLDVEVREAYYHWWDKDKSCPDPRKVWLS